MFVTIFGFLARIGIGTIASKLAEAYAARQNAETEQERIAAEERIRTLEARRDVQVAEAGSPINALVRAMFAFPVAAYYAKIFLWDKVLSLGRTDPLSQSLTEVSMIVIGFYFLAEGAAQLARIAKR